MMIKGITIITMVLVCHTGWQSRALYTYSNTSNTHTHTQTTHAHTHTHTHTQTNNACTHTHTNNACTHAHRPRDREVDMAVKGCVTVFIDS